MYRLSGALVRPQVLGRVTKARLPVATFSSSNISLAGKSLKEVDPETYHIVQKEQQRQIECLELIASENFASQAVREALSTCLTNKYSEGYPGARYYAGNEFIDENERLCQDRALKAFRLNPELWGVNVQSLSGAPANFQVYNSVLRPHDRIMGLDLPHGGHLSHGFMSAKKRISATSIYFESMPYRLDETTGLINYAQLELTAGLFRPNLIIAGASAYAREYDYRRMRQIADQNGAYLLSDIAHIGGLLAADVLKQNPFEVSDFVTTTTHKTLRGPRAGLIFFRRGNRGTNGLTGAKLPGFEKEKEAVPYDLEEKVNFSVFPSTQGGPHNNTIAAISVALKEALSPEFKTYQQQVLKNCQALAKRLMSKGYTLVSNGTDNHLILLDLRPQGIDGARVDAFLDTVNITVNKNAVPGDLKPLVPGGIRIGTPALTSRAFKEADFERVADFVDRGIKLALKANAVGENAKKLKSFKDFVANQPSEEAKALRAEVTEFAKVFQMPGV
eukprot:TRINITY_DN23281_c0_g1_i1.p1 TRINITY_DN23281_c0_g1~~TRINITY_DN23281_c0_g1_i1.p1  ORF type:complete len:504 (-),score=32.19 TRINITY_DN23281_c0_g1_i1:113-1624(-)